MEYVLAFTVGLTAIIALPGGRWTRRASTLRNRGPLAAPVTVWALGCLLTGALAVLVKAAGIS
jgi:hypothetical protein